MLAKQEHCLEIRAEHVTIVCRVCGHNTLVTDPVFVPRLMAIFFETICYRCPGMDGKPGGRYRWFRWNLAPIADDEEFRPPRQLILEPTASSLEPVDPETIARFIKEGYFEGA